MNKLDRARATRFFVRASMALSVVVLSACSNMHSIRDVPEALDSEFDNASPREFITPIDLAKIKLGMTPLEVRNRLGPPMLSNQENEKRWDYVLKKNGNDGEKYVPYAVYFQDYKVVKLAELEPPPPSIVKAGEAPAAPAPAEPAPAPAAAAPAVDLGASVEAPAPSMETGGQVDDAAAINDMVNGWAQAWSSKDVNKYLSYYADTFEHHMKSRKAWVAQRKQRLGKPGSISVNVSDVKISMQSDSLANVTFKQDYTSDGYTDSGEKTLVLSKASGSWKIQSESFDKK
ncbi:L,D-transpeptidase Cds6 family protein [Limnobacter litoralis]|uniref:Outer membrane protein assembly factor BamE n=1 Tax=Limnobacter litoralis TaxID=481366 RepID=A0ABQ5YTM9_9BURK|nr:outer membrane protein assembly factor BamE [Limnobacter litoralis]GLR26797.1 hypothetical protein GCM10007875_18870 [Limnobacter litoralis]